MDPIKLGVIGTGLAWERLHYPAIQELGDRYQVVAVCDQDRSRAEAAAAQLGLGKEHVYTDYRELLGRFDVEAVDILVPIPLNYEISEEAARAGKHIICEKPLGSDMKEAQAHRDLPKKYDVQIMIAENYRYNEENNIIRQLVQEKKIGDVIYFVRNDVTCFPCNMPKETWEGTEWRQHPDFAGGALLDSALHDIAAIRHIFGPVRRLHAMGRPQGMDFSPYMSVHVNAEFFSGVIGHFTYWPNGSEPQRPLLGTRIFGTDGMIYMEERSCGVVNLFHLDGTAEQFAYTPGRGYYNELLNFYNALRGNETISVTPEVEYGDVRMVFAILESLKKNGAVVDVDKKAPQAVKA